MYRGFEGGLKTGMFLEVTESWCPGAAATNPYIMPLLGIFIKPRYLARYLQHIDTPPKTLDGWLDI